MTEETPARIPASLAIFFIALAGTVALAGVAVWAAAAGIPPGPWVALGPVFLFALASVGTYAGAREKFPPGKRTSQNRFGLLGNLVLFALYLVLMLVVTFRGPA